LIRLPSDLLQILLTGGTVVVPSRQRAHAARLAFAATQLEKGARVWDTPDILPVDAWLVREIEELASASGKSLPRVLSPAEDWLLWRQCTANSTRDIDLLNRGALAESLRRASSLAVEYGINISNLPSFAGAEAELLHRTQQAVDESYRGLDAANIQSLIAQLPDAPGSSEITCAGFLKLSPRLTAIGGCQRTTEAHLALPNVVIATDEPDELEHIAEWCKLQIAAREDTRLLVVLPGSPGSRERLATLIRQAVDPEQWLSPSSAESASESLVVIEGGAPLSDVPVVAHALATLRWLGGSNGEFEEVSEWLRAPYWDSPRAGFRARIDLWLRESGRMSINGREWASILNAAPAPISEGAQELSRQVSAAVNALGDGIVSPREWSERFRSALDAVHWPGERVRDSSEQQTVVRLHELLDEFGQLASSAGAMSREEAIHWFGELASRTAFRPADDDAVVTISSALADPVVLYDGIWVAGLHAEAFPQPVQPDPFLPLPAQVAAGIPASSAGGRLAEARGLLTAWRAATDTLVLSVPSRAEDLELLPSPLLAQWTTNEDHARRLHGEHPVANPISTATKRAATSANPATADRAPGHADPGPPAVSASGAAASKVVAKPMQADLFDSPTTAPISITGPSGAAAGTAIAPETATVPAVAGSTVRGPEPSAFGSSTVVSGMAGWLAERIHRPDMLEFLEDSMGVPWPPGQTLPAGTRSLELQNLCGFRAYAELRLGSTELGAPEPGVAPDERGQLLHAALQILWGELRDSATLAGHAEPTLDGLIEQSVTKAADAILGQATDNVRSPLFARECRRTVRLIKRLCVLELTRDPFRVQNTEFEKTLTVAGAQMNVRIDRLDALESGGQAILDYKSGRRTTADWYGERPSHPQLLAYLAAVGGDVTAMATVNVTAREVRFDGIASSAQLLPKVRGVDPPVGEASGNAWDVRRVEWMACIERLAMSFLSGRAVVDPKPGACDWCHAVSVCRVSDGGIDVTAELLPLKFEGQQ
jgi:RecB family exonuclease